MMKKSYKRIGAVKTTINILRFLADQREPVSGLAISQSLNIPHGTAMCYLASLEDERYARRIGEHYELGQDAAILWTRRKARLRTIINNSEEQLAELEVS